MNVGDRIPEVLGTDQDGKLIKASDYRGRKIVLYSYLLLSGKIFTPSIEIN